MPCDRDETVLRWDSYGSTYSRLAAQKHPWTLNPAEQCRAEDALKPCLKDGGRFAFANPPLCSHCNQSIEFLVPSRKYLVVTGRQIDADAAGMWRLPPETRTPFSPVKKTVARTAECLQAATAMRRRAEGGCWKEKQGIPDADHHQRSTREHDRSERAVAVQQSKDKRRQRRDCENRPNECATMRHTRIGDSISEHRDDEESRYQAE
jgi:hypothetical protein